MNNLLLIIDLQESFINNNIKNVSNNIKKLIDSNIANNIVFTKFINIVKIKVIKSSSMRPKSNSIYYLIDDNKIDISQDI